MLLPMRSPAVETYEKNADAWAHGRLLQVGKAHFLVDRNPPLVEKVMFDRSTAFLCPAVPENGAVFVNAWDVSRNDTIYVF